MTFKQKLIALLLANDVEQSKLEKLANDIHGLYLVEGYWKEEKKN